MRTYDEIEVQIMHANSDDTFNLFDATVENAQAAACKRIQETWDEHLEENGGSGGFPYYGVKIEAYDLNDTDAFEESSTGPLEFYYVNDELRADWS